MGFDCLEKEIEEKENEEMKEKRAAEELFWTNPDDEILGDMLNDDNTEEDKEDNSPNMEEEEYELPEILGETNLSELPEDE